jgi:UDP-2,4-diacetamido-2,4,6-trideoxy-beta-L-altropyranose hydrolase
MIMFRADGNSRIGSGHIMRCIAIADAAREKGVESVFVTADDSPCNLIESHGYRLNVLGSKYDDMLSETSSLRNVIEKERPECIIVDSYFVNRAYFDTLISFDRRDYSFKIAYIDDLMAEAYPCHYLINYSIDNENKAIKYKKIYEDAGLGCPELMIGTEYVPLREEFMNGILSSKENNIAHDGEVRNILVLTGGSDVTHTALAILNYLNQHDMYKHIIFHFVIGALNKDKGLIEELAGLMDNVVLHENVTNMSELMVNSDIAVSAGGTTLFELCTCSVPVISYICADNQTGADALNAVLGLPKAIDARNNNEYVDELFQRIDYLRQNGEERIRLSVRENELVDGNGADRIIRRLINN